MLQYKKRQIGMQKKRKEYKISGDRIVSKRNALKIKQKNYRCELRKHIIILKVTNARQKKTYMETLKVVAFWGMLAKALLSLTEVYVRSPMPV